MRVAQFQDDGYSFIDKLSGRRIYIYRKDTVREIVYRGQFRQLKKLQIITHNTHLVDYCETN